MRLTRFSALAKLGEKVVLCFLPNPGRLENLLVSGVEVVLRKVDKGMRKTAYDLVGVYCGGRIVSVDSRVPNKLVFKALKNRDLPEFARYNLIKPEHFYGHTRFDFFLSDEVEPCLLEVKSCTLVRNGVAMFPDAPTKRGTKHLMKLIKAKNEGYRACVLFVIQRPDVKVFKPNDEMDRVFGDTLRQSLKHGVEVYAYSSQFAVDKITLVKKVEVVV